MSEHRTPIDPDAVRDAMPIEAIIGKYVTLAKDGHEYKACCPFHKERTPSFHVVPAKGFYHCFGCGAHGDGIDFVMQHHQVGFRDACAIISGENVAPLTTRRKREANTAPDVYAAYRPIVPVPDDAPAFAVGKRTVPLWNPKRDEDENLKKREPSYVPSNVHPYRTSDGALIGYVLRIEFGPREKITPQFMFCEMPDGGRRWCHHPFPTPRTLYGAELLAADPYTPALILEGEKKTDIARRRLTGALVAPFIPVSWVGGTGGVGHADFDAALFAGRQVYIWPDADAEGNKAAQRIAAILAACGCEVWIIDTSGLPHKFDAADLPDDEDMEAWIVHRARPFIQSPPADEIPHAEPHDDAYIPDHEPVGIDPVRHIERQPSRRDIESSIGAVTAATPGSEILRIADDIAAAHLNAVDVKTFSDRLAEQSGRSIKREVSARIKDSQRAIASRHREQVVSESDITKRYVFVKPLDRFWDRITANFLTDSAINKAHLRDAPLNADGGPIPPTAVLCGPNGGDVVDGINFWPGKPEIMHDSGFPELNTWRAPAYDAVEGDAGPFLDHVAYIMNLDDEATAYVLDYMAHMIQRPADKIRSTILIISPVQGNGKSLIAEMLGKIIGRRFAKAVTNEEIKSDFNEWIDGAQFIWVNELMSMGRQDMMNKLKEYITTDLCRINAKGIRPYSYVSRVNFMLFSNHKDAANIENHDRRYYIWFSDAEAHDPCYFADLWRWFDNGGAEALHHHLANRPISHFDRHAAAPMTDAKRETIRASGPDWRSFLQEAFDDNGRPFRHDLVNGLDVITWMSRETRHQITPQKLAAFLKDIGAEQIENVIIDGCRRRVWAIRRVNDHLAAGAAAASFSYKPIAEA